jgi:hypothetical protein
MPPAVTSDDMCRRFAGMTRYYRMEDEFRRAAAWAVAAGFGLPLIALAIDLWQGFPRGQEQPLLLIGVGWAVSAWLSQALVPVVRIDSRGVAHRSFWVWHLWDWAVFSEPGRVVPLPGGTGYLLKGAWPPTSQLSLGLLPESDIEEIDSLIRSVLRSPVERPPESINVRIPWLSLEFTSAGIRYRHNRTEGVCAWIDVRRVEIWRSTHGRRDFRELILVLPDQSLRVFRVEGYEKRVALSEFLMRQLVGDRVQELSLSGSVRSLAEIDARIARLRKLADEQSNDKPIVACLLLTASILALLFLPLLKVLVLVAVFSPIILVGFIFVHHERLNDQAEMAALQRQRMDFSGPGQANGSKGELYLGGTDSADVDYLFAL